MAQPAGQAGSATNPGCAPGVGSVKRQPKLGRATTRGSRIRSPAGRAPCRTHATRSENPARSSAWVKSQCPTPRIARETNSRDCPCQPGPRGVHLLHRERHEQVADVVQRQHRDPRVAEDLRDAGQPARGRGGRCHPQHGPVQRPLGRGEPPVPVLDPVDGPPVAGHVAVGDPDRAAGQSRIDPEQERDVRQRREAEAAPEREGAGEAGPRPAAALLHRARPRRAQRGQRHGRRVAGVEAAPQRGQLGEDLSGVRRRVRLPSRQRLREADVGPGERGRRDVGVQEVVEQLLVAEHPAVRHRADEVAPVALDGDGGDVPAHRLAGQVDRPGLADRAAEETDQRLRVAYALADVVAVRRVAGRRPGEAALT